MSVDSSPQSKTERVARYLREQATQADGSLYIKSRFVADDIDLSPREIGASIHRIDERKHGLSIEKWAYTSGTTWRVSLAE